MTIENKMGWEMKTIFKIQAREISNMCRAKVRILATIKSSVNLLKKILNNNI